MNYPQDFIRMIMQGQNPEQLMLNFLEQQNSPMGKNLYNLAANKRTADIEQIARNIAAQKGIDFDTAFNSFKQSLGIK